MSELRELYQSVIIDHNKSPRNRGEPEGANRRAEGHNPLCGDHVIVSARVSGDRIEAAGFDGRGCAISTASASLMTEAVRGRAQADVKQLFEDFHRLVTTGEARPDSELGKLEVFAGVHEFPLRVKCATLCWHALRAALEGGESVSTE
ncbi:MAG TPA: SUF system NifU family Fe-S cluster assembly protein [Myxococcota bacterium]|nr:SUF system NifU family Fe-S cluster assembly protein [Myxococcota bacterium]